MKRFITLAVLASAALAVAAPLTPPSLLLPTGAFAVERGAGTLDITEGIQPGLTRSSRAFVLWDYGANGHTCNLSGTVVQDQAAFSDPLNKSSVCVVKFIPSAGGIRVQATPQETCANVAGCGSNVTVGGFYTTVPAGCLNTPAGYRSLFNVSYKIGNFVEALTHIKLHQEQCSRFEAVFEQQGIDNELALTQYRAGQYQDCRNTLTKWPNVRLSFEELRDASPFPYELASVVPHWEKSQHILALCEADIARGSR